MTKYLQDVTANKYLGIILILNFELHSNEISYLDCYKLEDSIIVSQDGTFLGRLGKSYKTDSIYNEYSNYGSSYSNESIWNDLSEYGNSYSQKSAFNEYASEAPLIIKDGEVIGKLSVNNSYLNNNFDPRQLKTACDW